MKGKRRCCIKEHSMANLCLKSIPVLRQVLETSFWLSLRDRTSSKLLSLLLSFCSLSLSPSLLYLFQFLWSLLAVLIVMFYAIHSHSSFNFTFYSSIKSLAFLMCVSLYEIQASRISLSSWGGITCWSMAKRKTSKHETPPKYGHSYTLVSSPETLIPCC